MTFSCLYYNATEKETPDSASFECGAYAHAKDENRRGLTQAYKDKIGVTLDIPDIRAKKRTKKAEIELDITEKELLIMSEGGTAYVIPINNIKAIRIESVFPHFLSRLVGEILLALAYPMVPLTLIFIATDLIANRFALTEKAIEVATILAYAVAIVGALVLVIRAVRNVVIESRFRALAIAQYDSSLNGNRKGGGAQNRIVLRTLAEAENAEAYIQSQIDRIFAERFN